MIAALAYLWFLGFVIAIFAQAQSLPLIPRGERVPPIHAVILAYAWPATLLYMAFENRKAIAAWFAERDARAAKRDAEFRAAVDAFLSIAWLFYQGFRRWERERAADAADPVRLADSARFLRGEHFGDGDDWIDDPTRGWHLPK